MVRLEWIRSLVRGPRTVLNQHVVTEDDTLVSEFFRQHRGFDQGSKRLARQ